MVSININSKTKKLIHGGDIYSAKERFAAMENSPEVLDFSANINPLGLPDGVKIVLKESIDSFDAYPDPLCRELVLSLSVYEEVPVEWIFCGNGAADIIYRTVSAIKPKKAMVLAPTFAEYEEALNTVSCTVTRFKLYESNNYQLQEDFLDALTEDMDMLFLCNPNNPTGQLIPREFLLIVLKRCRELNILLFVDECFNDFLEEPTVYSVKEYMQEYDNLLILKAFTKIYAMAGIRLGHCITSNKELIKKLHEAGQPWSVSTPAQMAGIQAIKEREYLTRAKALIQEEREYLTENLKRCDFTVFPSNANYIFIKDACNRQKPLYEMLFEKGILIRNCDNYHGLSSGYYRICIRRHEDNIKLIEVLEEVKD